MPSVRRIGPPHGGPERRSLRSRIRRRFKRIPHPHFPELSLSQVRVPRLFILLFLFSLLVLYGVFRSTRFQEVMRRKVQRVVSARIHREVRIGRFDLSLVPPAFVVRDVWVGNDPRGLKGAPCFSADEIALKGIPDVSRSLIDLPKIRVLQPRIVFEVFADGTDNLTPILEAIGKGSAEGQAPDIRLRQLVLQHGSFRFREWDSRIDAVLEDAAVSARSGRFSRATHVSLACRRAGFRIEENRVLHLSIGIEATLAPGRFHLDQLRLRSDFITLDGSGGIEDLTHPDVVLSLTAATTGEALHEIFGLKVPIGGGIAVAGNLRISSRDGLRVRGRFEIPEGRFGPFALAGAGGAVRLDDDGFLLHLERAAYAGGNLEALVRLERLKHPPLPVRIDVRGRGISFERFLADLDLPGTGLMAQADVDTTLTFSHDVEKADGAGSFRLAALPGVPSAVAGRHALPVTGGGPLLIRRGKITFPGTPLETAGGARMTLDGTLALGSWEPDWTLAVKSPAPEVERIAENLYAAIQKKKLAPPLKLDGEIELTARLTRAFGDPRVEGRIAGSDFFLRGVRFGKVDGSFLVDHRVLTLAPFHAVDVGGSLTLGGDVAWGGDLGDEYLLRGFSAEFDRWPIERPLKFLEFDLPITGTVTGTLPLAGVTPEVLGSVPLVLAGGTVWGQPVERLAGTLAFEKERLVLSGVTGRVAGGSVTGVGWFRYDDKAYGLDARVDGLAFAGLPSVQEALAGLSGIVTGTLAGEGTIERPTLAIRASVLDPALDGRPLAPAKAPALVRVETSRGALSAAIEVAGGARFEVDVPADPAGELHVRLEVDSMAPYGSLLRIPEEAQLQGTFVAEATARRVGGEVVSVEGEIARADLRAWGRKVWLGEPAPFRWDGKRLGFKRLALHAADPAAEESSGELVVSGTLETAEPQRLDVSVNGSLDAGLLEAALPEAKISGQIAAAARIGGTLSRPDFDGRLFLDGVDLLPPGSSSPFEGITGIVTLAGDRASVSGMTFHWGGGTVGVDGSVGLLGLKLGDIRIGAHLTRVRNEPFEGFRAIVSGDIVLRGEGTLRSVSGELTLDSGVYDQDVSLGLGTLLAGLRPSSSLPPPATSFDAVTLNVLVRIPPGTIAIRNNLGKVRASGELNARGTWGRPVLYGQLSAEEGGRLELRGQRYELLSGKVLFSGGPSIDPYYEVSARTTIKEYQITLDLSGTGSRLAMHLTSDPQLSQAQVVSLLLTGELPGQSTLGVPTGTAPVSTDESVATAARDLIASLATEAATERTKNLFRLDRLQIDPVFVGSSFDAPKLTVGKAISKNLTVTYSYKASANQEQIVTAEYELSRGAFLQFVRDETGVYAVDVKFRQRLR